jgi:hypothetical protein
MRRDNAFVSWCLRHAGAWAYRDHDFGDDVGNSQVSGRRVMWNTMDTLPDVGRKFICLYNDGSGAVMFWRYDDGYIDQDGEDCQLEGKQYDRWAYLPDELEFWCETRSEDPMCLTLPSDQCGGGA